MYLQIEAISLAFAQRLHHLALLRRQVFLFEVLLICMGFAGAASLHAEQLSITNHSDWQPVVMSGDGCNQAPYQCVLGSYAYLTQNSVTTLWTTSSEACQFETRDPDSYYAIHPANGEGCYYHPYRSQNDMSEFFLQNWVTRVGTCHGIDPVVGSVTRTFDEPVRCVICADGFRQPQPDSYSCLPVINRVHEPSPLGCAAKGEPVTPNPIYPLKGIKRQSEDLMAWSSLERLSMTYDTRRKVLSTGGKAAPAIGEALPSFGELWASNMHKRLVFTRNSSSSVLSVAASRGSGVWFSFIPDATGAYQAGRGGPGCLNTETESISGLSAG